MSTNFSERVLGPGAHSSRPAATSVPEGTLYSCTDDVKVYVSRAGAWVDWVTVNPGGGAVVGYPAPFRAEAHAVSGSAGTSVVVNKPTGTISGDLMIAAVGYYNNPTSVTAPSGWTLIRTDTQTTHPSTESKLYYKVAGGGEPSNYTWTLGTSRDWAAVIATYRDVDTGDPLDGDNGSGQTTTVTILSGTVTATTGRRVVNVATIRDAGRAGITPSGMLSERSDQASSGTSIGVRQSLQDGVIEGSIATGTLPAVATGTTTNSSNVGQTVVINPAP